MKIKAAIFDLDGTLVDSMFIWETIGADYLLSRGITPEPGLNDKFKNMSIVQAAEYYRENYGIADSVEEIINGVNSMIEHLYFHAVKLKDGVPEVLEVLQSQGVRMCIATATDKYMVDAALKNNHIDKYFAHVFTCTEVGAGKDSPVIYERAMEFLGGNKEDTLVFEDAAYAVRTAKGAGFKVAGVFDKSAGKDSEEIERLSDYFIRNYDDYRRLLK